MLLVSRSWVVAIAAIVAVTCTACQSQPPEQPVEKEKAAPATVKEKEASPPPSTKPSAEPSAEPSIEPSAKPSAEPAAKPAHKSAVHKPKPQLPPPPPAIPKVFLSNEIRAACLVKVGDTLPEAELPDPAGKLHALESLYGQKLTIVCFWTIGTTHRSRLVAVAALQDLVRDIAEPFGPKDVRVIAINVGDAVAAVQKESAQAGVKFPSLLDPKGEYFAKIAKDKRMPRTFLLDAAGRVLWFDVEYSRPSRRDLIQGIRVALGEL